MSIIVPTYDRPSYLQSTVCQLLEQSFTDFELWVIDQSEPDQAEITKNFVEATQDERLHYVHLTTKGLPNARNVGLSRAQGEIVVFTDDDVILLSRDFLSAHLQCFEDAAVGGVVGRHVERYVEVNSRTTACHVSWNGRTIFNLLGTRRQEIGSCKGSNMSFRMTAVAQIGGFDRRTHLLEDTDFSVRIAKAGWTLLFEPQAEIVHLSATAGGVRELPGLKTEMRRFRSTAYFMGKHRSTVQLIAFLVTFSLIAAIRAIRFRSWGTLPALARATLSGLADARLPPRQELDSALKEQAA